MSTKAIERAERLAEARPALRDSAIKLFAAGGVIAAAELLLFDWDAGDMLVGTLVGTCAWGALYHLTETGKLIPRGVLQEAPRGVEIQRGPPNRLSGYWLIGLAALCLPVAWLVDRLAIGAAFVPGAPFGYGAAALIALVRISRWERGERRRVLFDPEEDRPYAGPPL